MPNENTNQTLPQAIEAILFAKGESMTVKELAALFKAQEGEVRDAVMALEASLAGHGIGIMQKDGSVTLATSTAQGELIAEFRKAELEKELSKASIETLAIITYKETASRSEIDYLRGVNAGFILKNLMMRGLVERITDPADSRKYLYKPTFEALAFLGVQKASDLPDFEAVRGALASGISNTDEQVVE